MSAQPSSSIDPNDPELDQDLEAEEVMEALGRLPLHKWSFDDLNLFEQYLRSNLKVRVQRMKTKRLSTELKNGHLDYPTEKLVAGELYIGTFNFALRSNEVSQQDHMDQLLKVMAARSVAIMFLQELPAYDPHIRINHEGSRANIKSRMCRYHFLHIECPKGKHMGVIYDKECVGLLNHSHGVAAVNASSMTEFEFIFPGCFVEPLELKFLNVCYRDSHRSTALSEMKEIFKTPKYSDHIILGDFGTESKQLHNWVKSQKSVGTLVKSRTFSQQHLVKISHSILFPKTPDLTDNFLIPASLDEIEVFQEGDSSCFGTEFSFPKSDHIPLIAYFVFGDKFKCVKCGFIGMLEREGEIFCTGCDPENKTPNTENPTSAVPQSDRKEDEEEQDEMPNEGNTHQEMPNQRSPHKEMPNQRNTHQEMPNQNSPHKEMPDQRNINQEMENNSKDTPLQGTKKKKPKKKKKNW